LAAHAAKAAVCKMNVKSAAEPEIILHDMHEQGN